MRVISITDPKTLKETTAKVVSVKNAPRHGNLSLRQLIERRFKKLKLNLASLEENNGVFSIQAPQCHHSKYHSSMPCAVFDVSVPVKVCFNESGMKVSGAIITFQLIAHDCYWHEGYEKWVWEGDQEFKYYVDEEVCHVVPTYRNKPVDFDPSGRWLEKGGLSRWDSEGIANTLIAALICNTPIEHVKEVLNFVLVKDAQNVY